MAKNWYIIHTYTGYEAKIERTLRLMLENGEIDKEVLTDIRVPTEEVAEVKNGKKVVRNNKFLPGYIMLELDLPQFDWKKTCNAIRKVQGVTGFVGTEPSVRPVPLSTDEARNLLMASGAIKGERNVHIKQSFDVGDQVKIIDGPFAQISGVVEEVQTERNKLRVNVQIFGRSTPVEVDLMQVEKVKI